MSIQLHGNTAATLLLRAIVLVVRGDHICPCTHRGQIVTCSGYFVALKKIAPGKCHPKCPFGTAA